jgi:hypothetical protein
MRQRDSHILPHYTTYTATAARPGFDVANFQQIYPIAHGKLPIPHTSISLTAFVFNDDDLYSNLFGVSPLTEHGLSATYTNDDLQITIPTPYGPKTILYGVKQPGDNVWRFSLPKSRLAATHNVIRHEQEAKLALYASATFGSPTFKTFYDALLKGWLSNYPSLTAKILSRNQPHSPATALGHITASRSGIRSIKPKTPVNKKRKRHSSPSSPAESFPAHDVLATTRSQAKRSPAQANRLPAQDVLPTSTGHMPISTGQSPTSDTSENNSLGPPAVGFESLDHYEDHELLTTILQTRILPPSELRDNNAMFSDLTGRFPATAMDGSQYILLLVYKRYIHIELLASRSESAIIDAYSHTYQCFFQLGHYVQFQVMDNEAPKGLRQHFIIHDIHYQFVPPFTKRSNKAERAISSQYSPTLTRRSLSSFGTNLFCKQKSP